jgi:predicted RNA-binding protein YlqC (UPF0109 family)
MSFDPVFWQNCIPDQSKIFNVYAELSLASVVLAMICMCLFKRASDGFKAVTFLGLTISAIAFGNLAKKSWDESNAPPPFATAAEAAAWSASHGVGASSTLGPDGRPLVTDHPVEVKTHGNAVDVKVEQTLVPGATNSGQLTISFLKQTKSDWIEVSVEQDDGKVITSSGHIVDSSPVNQTRRLADIAGKRITIRRWAPGFLNIPGTGGGDCSFIVPSEGNVMVNVTVLR